jgi:hypothetical protein
VRSDLVTEVERPWVDWARRAGIISVRNELLFQGVPASLAAGMAVWLDDQAHRRRHISEGGARLYRRRLELLDPSRIPG